MIRHLAEILDLTVDNFMTIEVDLGQADLWCAALLLELKELDVGHGVDVVGA